jgi:hypothetical protein
MGSARAIFVAFAKSAGMLALAYACMGAGVKLLAVVDGPMDAWWRLLPGLFALAWLSKKAAASGWWDRSGTYAYMALMIAASVAFWAVDHQGWSFLIVSAAGWSSSWPWALWRLRKDMEKKKAAEEAKLRREQARSGA